MTIATGLREQYGPWALIAGGSEGIGLAFAQQLAAAGLNLVLLARREAPLAAAQQTLASFDVEVRTHALDLTGEELEQALSQVTDGLDIGLLIYNAGAVHGASAFLDEPLQKAQQLIALNCTGPTVLSHSLAGAMRDRGRGGIIFVSSMSGLTGGAYIATYAATKSFDIVLAESLWAELHPAGVHVLGLIAGSTDTPAMAASGVTFGDGQAMDPMDVAREGLQRLPHGPVHVAGDGNRGAAALLRGPERRLAVALMSAGAAALYDLPMPQLPDDEP